jgi:two-component system, chemotaxis family, sensor kinase Cph1
VLTNLVANGLNYNDAEQPLVEVGVMTLDATTRGRELSDINQNAFADSPEPLVIYVADNGIGIAAEDREEAFRVFRRLHPDDKYGTDSGAGVRLSIDDFGTGYCGTRIELADRRHRPFIPHDHTRYVVLAR